MTLPIDVHLPRILSLALEQRSLLLQAAPGAGKSTRVPKALVDAGAQGVLVLQPRRLAAKVMAQFVAKEFGETVGGVVGYQVRQENRTSLKTQLCFLTEGLFLRRVLGDPRLKGVDWVVLDEFHERHLHTDLAFAVVRALRKTTRPDLGLIVMSATLDMGSVQEALPGVAVVEVPGRTYPIEIIYQNPFHHRLGELPLERQVALAVERLWNHFTCTGHILVFLPGEREIQRCLQMCSGMEEKGASLFALKADLPAPVQDQVFAPCKKRKIIFSTNVAETSLTIEGITGVVDSGLARVAGFSPWSGLPHLKVKEISQAACTQRAGRAGRTSPGVVVRLFTESQFGKRAPFEAPEIHRSDLSQLVLESLALAKDLGLTSPLSQFLIEPPPAKALESSYALLEEIGAIDGQGVLTPVGQAMARYPLHPRLSRTMVAGSHDSKKDRENLALAVALVQEGGVFHRGGVAPDEGSNDLDFHRDSVVLGEHKALTDRGAHSRVVTTWKQLCRLTLGFEPKDTPPQQWDSGVITQHLLKGFPDRVGELRADRRVSLCQGGSARLSPLSGVVSKKFILALDAIEIPGKSGDDAIVVTLATALDEVDLLDGSPRFLKDLSGWQWDEGAQGVRLCHELRYGSLLMESQKNYPPPYEELATQDQITVTKLLLPHVETALLERMGDSWPTTLQGQWWFFGKHCSTLGMAVPHGEFPWDTFLSHLATGLTHIHQLPQDLPGALLSFLPNGWAGAWSQMCPTGMTCANGRTFPIHYREGQHPWIVGRIQEFFGCAHTPQLGGKPLVIHLLAPNKQTVQVTQDLETFWKRDYPAVKRDLGRQYPRHDWPDSPATAKPPEKRVRKY